MAVSYNSLLADLESQINGIIATTPALTDSTYDLVAAGTSTVADRTSTDWSLAQQQQAIFDAEYEIIAEICFNPRHPERAKFGSSPSSGLVSGSALPVVDSGGSTPYVGVFNYAYETGTGTIFTERPMQIVQWAISNAGLAFSSPRVLIYCIAGGVVLHNSLTTLVFTGPAVARGTSFSGNMRLLDNHRPAVVAGALIKLLAKEGAWPDAFKMNADYYTAHIEQIRNVGQQVAVPYTAR